jgi:predicted CopG family antitoxin
MQEPKDKPVPTKTIVIRIETYQTLSALKIIPQEPFDSVIKRLLDRSADPVMPTNVPVISDVPVRFPDPSA